jgi:hypothetical protein
MCPLWWKSSYELQGMYGLQIATKDNISTSSFKTTHPPVQFKQILYPQPGVTYAQITKQYSYDPTNVEQEPHINQPHQQTSNIQDQKI